MEGSYKHHLPAVGSTYPHTKSCESESQHQIGGAREVPSLSEELSGKNGSYEERKVSFFRDVGPERLPMLSSVPHPADGAAHIYKQAALNGLHGYL